jgi:hypothetical protein
MTVEELIEELRSFDPSDVVAVNLGYGVYPVADAVKADSIRIADERYSCAVLKFTSWP